MTIHHALYGSLLGGAVGDAYGLPFEGLSPTRCQKFCKFDNHYHLIPLINTGMVSDDTEHAVMTVQAYIASGGDVAKFKQSLKWRLVAWLCGLPAGVGLATGRSIFKMMLGFNNTGVCSAGNGGAMRSAVLGVLCNNVEKLKSLVYQSTILTHADPKAYQGSLVIALLAWVECYQPNWTISQTLVFLNEQIDDKELLGLIDNYTPSKNGITGYMYDTVPAVVQTWQRYRENHLAGLNYLIKQGGDTDSTCAIFGGIVGVRFGEQMYEKMGGMWCEPKIRPSWLWALSEQATKVYVEKTMQKPLNLWSIWTYPRNFLFLSIVLVHGFRRLLPPYG